MNARIGQADARVSVLRDALTAGSLEPAIALIMDGIEPDWRANPVLALWESAYGNYDGWSRLRRRAPEPKDAGAAGMHGWLKAQAAAATNGTLTEKQLRSLQNLHGWTYGVELPETQGLYSIAFRLRAAGFPVGDSHARARADELLTAWAAAGGVVDENQCIDGTDSRNPDLRGLFTYVLFVAQNIRQPAAGEPGNRWRTAAKTNGTEDITWVAALLASTPGIGRSLPANPVFLARLNRHTSFVEQNKRRPSSRGKSIEERTCAAWAARQRARHRDELTTVTELALLVGAGGILGE
jgi:hypothetical protein